MGIGDWGLERPIPNPQSLIPRSSGVLAPVLEAQKRFEAVGQRVDGDPRADRRRFAVAVPAGRGQ
ncbi:MAG TPA: hypothetical protein DCX12_01015 [Chloroflexi bacterium]|nr:hypothetical protein [Chloroflexota bacterium]